MRWVITDDCLDDGRDIGAGNFPLDGRLAELPYRFRLLDDGGEVYYLGRSDDQDSEAAFAPLDWATGYAGCTEIQYRRDGLKSDGILIPSAKFCAGHTWKF